MSSKIKGKNFSKSIKSAIFNMINFLKTHQLHKLFNHNNVKVSYSSPPNFKSVINGHNKNTLNKQEKSSPSNCRDKTSCPLKGSCQHKNLVYSFKVSNPDLKQNHPHYIGLTEHTFKDWLYKHNNSFKYESKRNSTHIEAISCQVKINCEFSKWRISFDDVSTTLRNTVKFTIFYIYIIDERGSEFS